MKVVAIIFEYLFLGFTMKNPGGVMEQISCGIDSTRMAAQVVSGIGFLGTGTISGVLCERVRR